jgi:hypothetical protein
MDDNTRLILESNFHILRALESFPRSILHAATCHDCGAIADKINDHLREHDSATARFNPEAPAGQRVVSGPANAEFPTRTDRILDTNANALLLLQARHVLKNLDAERPGAGYMKLAQACGDAAESVRLMEAARVIVSPPAPSYGYVDIGDALVACLRGRIDVDEALRLMHNLSEGYAQDRAANGRFER